MHRGCSLQEQLLFHAAIYTRSYTSSYTTVQFIRFPGKLQPGIAASPVQLVYLCV